MAFSWCIKNIVNCFLRLPLVGPPLSGNLIILTIMGLLCLTPCGNLYGNKNTLK